MLIFAFRFIVKIFFGLVKLWNNLLIWKIYWGVKGERMNIFSNFSFVYLDSGYQLTSSLLQHFFNAYWSCINIIEGVLYSLPQRSYNLNWQFRRIISLFQELEHSKISDLLKVIWNVQKASTSSFHCPVEIHPPSYPWLWERSDTWAAWIYCPKAWGVEVASGWGWEWLASSAAAVTALCWQLL